MVKKGNRRTGRTTIIVVDAIAEFLKRGEVVFSDHKNEYGGVYQIDTERCLELFSNTIDALFGRKNFIKDRCTVEIDGSIITITNESKKDN